MKKIIFILILGTLMSFKIADIFTDLGATKSEVQEDIFSSLSSGYLNFPSKCQKIALANRVSIVQAIGAFARNYSKTDDFKKRYAEWWKDQEPTKPESPEAKLTREKAELDKSTSEGEKQQKEMIETIKKQIASTKDAAIKKQYEESLKMMAEMQIQLKKQTENPEYQQQMKQMYESTATLYAEEYKTKMEEYNTNFADWNTNKNPNTLIKKRLGQFLEISSSVDFNAQLKTEGNRKEFVNEEYQQKDDVWKRCFRSGKPAIDASRTIAQEWIKEL